MPHEPYESYDAWAQEKMDLENALIAKAAEEKEEEAAKRAAQQAKADAAFARWTVDQRVHEAALKVLPRLAPMGGSEEDWQKVLTMYAYTFNYLNDQHAQYAVDVSENPKRSLEHVFGNFTRKTHTFDKVSLRMCTLP